MSSNPKRAPAKSAGLPLEDADVLKVDDPRPQRVTQYPTTGAKRVLKKQEEAIPTSVFDTEQHDQELRASYGPDSVNDGYRPAFLYVERGPGAGQLVQVRQGVMVIGRASVADLRLQHPSISRRHAQVKRVGEQFFVRDLGSQNGTFVNKHRIAAELEISPGDTLSLGNAMLKLRGPMAKGESPRPSEPVRASRPSAKPLKTAVVMRQTSRSSSMVKVAIFTGATMFGLGVVLALALLRSGPDHRERSKTAAAQGVVPAGSTGDITISLEDTKVRQEKQIDEALKKKMAETKGNEPEERHSTVARAATGKRSEDEEADDAPKKGPAGKRAAILSAYEKGNAEGSLDAAKQAGDKALERQLSDFIATYDAAESAVSSGDGSNAIRNYEKALKLDEGLSSGWGKYGALIRKQLSNLYTLVGMAHLKADNAKNAKLAFATAYKYDPSNDKAKEQLQKLGGGDEIKSGKVAKTAADDAFGDDDDEDKPAKKAAPAKKAKSRTQAIDDAFGD